MTENIHIEPEPEPEEEPEEEINESEAESEESFLGALAYCQGYSISYQNSAMRDAANLVAHEAWHVIQQNSNRQIRIDAIDAKYQAVANDHSGERTAVLRDNARDYRASKISAQDRDKRNRVRNKGVALLLGIKCTDNAGQGLLLGIIDIVESLKKSAPVDEDVIEGFDKDTLQILVRHINQYLSQPDSALWESMVKFCNSCNPGWQAQLLMLDTVKRFTADISHKWIWRGDDQAVLVDAIIDAYQTTPREKGQSVSSTIYYNLNKLTYDGYKEGKSDSLPRDVAADVAELAITQLIK